MDGQLRLSKEHGRSRCDDNRDLSAIECREYTDQDLEQFGGILWEFWIRVNGEDLGEISEYSSLAGRKITKAEAKIYHFQYERCRIHLAISNCEIVGFLVYHLAYSCVLAVECLYVIPAFEKRGLGKELIASLNQPIKKVLFQTHIKNSPKRLLQITNDKQITELHRAGDLVTWEMPWHGRIL